MPQFATVTGDVTYTPGDGVAGVTAIPRTQFDDYLRDGMITWEKN